MFNKSFFIYVMWVFLFLTSGCSNESVSKIEEASTYLTVLEKTHSYDYKEAWIIGSIDNQIEEKEIKLIVEEPMVWNLIQENQEYFVSYTVKEDGEIVISQISYPGDDRAIR